MLADKTGDGMIWIVNSNPGDYGLYYYNGTTLTKKLSDTGNGTLAYKADGTLMYKSAASNYYKCLNGVVTVDSNPSLISLGYYMYYQPNGGSGLPGLVFNDINGCLILDESGAGIAYLPTVKAIDRNQWNVAAPQNYACSVYGADLYVVMSTLCTVVNASDNLQSVKTIVIRRPASAAVPLIYKELPGYQYRITHTTTSIADVNHRAFKARYVAGEGLYVYHLGTVVVTGGPQHAYALHETFYPIDLNF